MKTLYNKITSYFAARSSRDGQFTPIRDTADVRAKIKQAVRESNLDQQEILNEYDRRFSTVQ
jgi:hypothetical protein